jgi:signal peptidase I
MQVGDQLAVEKVTKQLGGVRAYQRGDVVVFNPTQVRGGAVYG